MSKSGNQLDVNQAGQKPQPPQGDGQRYRPKWLAPLLLAAAGLAYYNQSSNEAPPARTPWAQQTGIVPVRTTAGGGAHDIPFGTQQPAVAVRVPVRTTINPTGFENVTANATGKSWCPQVRTNEVGDIFCGKVMGHLPSGEELFEVTKAFPWNADPALSLRVPQNASEVLTGARKPYPAVVAGWLSLNPAP